MSIKKIIEVHLTAHTEGDNFKNYKNKDKIYIQTTKQNIVFRNVFRFIAYFYVGNVINHCCTEKKYNFLILRNLK